MIVRYTLRRGTPLTSEMISELEEIKKMRDEDIVFDEDAPKLTDEQLRQFKRVNPLRKKAAG